MDWVNKKKEIERAIAKCDVGINQISAQRLMLQGQLALVNEGLAEATPRPDDAAVANFA